MKRLPIAALVLACVAPVSALGAILDFRLAAADGLAAARKRAESLKMQSIGDRATIMNAAGRFAESLDGLASQTQE